MLCPTNMEQAGMAEGQGRLDPSPIRLLVRQSADAQLATHAGERGGTNFALPVNWPSCLQFSDCIETMMTLFLNLGVFYINYC